MKRDAHQPGTGEPSDAAALAATATPADAAAPPGPMSAARAAGVRASPRALLKLARPRQWSKGAFVLIGPLYGQTLSAPGPIIATVLAFFAFALASSACYVVNDLLDRHVDRLHPRKRSRPLASGAVTPREGVIFAAALLAGALLCCGGVAAAGAWSWAGPEAIAAGASAGGARAAEAALWLTLTVVAYVANVLVYSFSAKHRVILDVMSLSLGFVLRVLGGCAAVLVEPSSWLLNVTFFVSMFLALGKRLGERRVAEAGPGGQGPMGGDEPHPAAVFRGVHAVYTDALLRMLVVVTGVATLLTYAGYVQSQAERYTVGFNLLWLTMLPATYGLLRCIVLTERGQYDDPTELARADRPFQLAALIFVAGTVALMLVCPGSST